MREAGVTIVSLAIFSWARLEPAARRLRLRLARRRDGPAARQWDPVDLATATASPPPWLTAAHPEILPVDRQGHTIWPGGRQHWRPTSPVFREHALRLVRAMATRYAGASGAGRLARLQRARLPQRLRLLRRRRARRSAAGCASAIRRWTRSTRRGGPRSGRSTTATGRRSCRRGSPPPTPTRPSSSTSSGSPRTRSRTICAPSGTCSGRSPPDVPVTTNFMVAGDIDIMDYADWAAEVDFVANDHYVRPGPQAPRRAVVLGQPDRQPGRRPAVVPDGALDQRGELAAGQRRRRSRASWPATR